MGSNAAQSGPVVKASGTPTPASSAGMPADLAGWVQPLADQLAALAPGGDSEAARAEAERLLQAIDRLGWRLSSAEAGASAGASGTGGAAPFRAALEEPGTHLIELYKRVVREADETFWASDDPFHALFVRGLISAGHTSAAFDYATAALRHRPNDRDLAYLHALALARGRNVRRARDAVERLLAALEEDEAAGSGDGDGPAAEARRKLRVETLSLAGRLLKDLGRAARSAAAARRYYRQSNERYAEADALSSDWYPAINAATTALLAGRKQAAQTMAASVVERAEADLPADGKTDDYWLLATLGEASLIRGEAEAAGDYYRRAVALAGDRFGDVASMRRNVELLGERIEVPRALREALALGEVVVFAGHMIDHPDRVAKRGLPPRFPPDEAMERAVAGAIAERLEAIDPVAGYCSAANGADLLFAEQMIYRGRELHIVLPFDLEDFFATSVDFGLTEMRPWRQRCEAVLAKAQVHYATAERYLGDDVLFDFTNRIMQGLAILRGGQFGVPARALVAFDQTNRNAGGGGTQGFAGQWTAGGRPLEIIDVGALREGLPPEAQRRTLPSPPAEARPTRTRARRRVQAMLFSDMHNFSRLEESHSPGFFRRFMRLLDELLSGADAPPALANTWGDALYMVFDEPAACAELALRLVERTERVDWRRYGLPDASALRVALHAGPVYRRMNKVIGRPDFFGSHVNLAARIEPVTTPGSVFVSEHFAAELTLADPSNYVCEYMGRRELAKRFGVAPLYRLDRA